PHRTEKPDVGTGRADCGKHGQTVLETIALSQERHAHRTAGAFDHLPRAHGVLAHARELAKTLLEDSLHSLRDAATLIDGAKHRGQIATRPEQFLEAVRLLPRAPQLGAF